MTQYTLEQYQDYQTRFPELFATMSESTDVVKTARHITRQFDAGTLPYTACDGAIACFKQFLTKVSFAPRGQQEVREDRILHIRYSDGKRVARRMSR